jgi:hypothetical protein
MAGLHLAVGVKAEGSETLALAIAGAVDALTDGT